VLRLVRSEPGLLLALVVGFALRAYQLTDQIVADDEWHAIHAVIYASYPYILTHFGLTDHSIPLTLFYRTMADTTGLSEAVMRAPVLAFGVATLLVVPLLVRARFGRPTSAVFAWVLAISPLHVYFSRYARPYAITLFFTFVGAVAFFEWWTGRGRRWGALYVVCAMLGPYFHLTGLPVLLAPLLFGVLERMRSRRAGETRSLAELGWLAAAVAAGLAALLLPPIVSDWTALASKVEKQSLEWATVRGAFELHLGTARAWLLLAAASVMVVGAVASSRRQPRFLVYWGFLAVCQLAVAVGGRPAGITVPITLARYALPLLPALLLMLAAGLVCIEDSACRLLRRYPVGLVGIAACGVLLYYGPLPRIYYRPNDWTNHGLFQYGYDPARNSVYRALRPVQIPAFYQQLRQLAPASLRLVEAPWYYEWHNNLYPYYQQVHRQHMSVGFVGDVWHGNRAGEIPLTRDGFVFRNVIHVFDHAALLRRGVRFVVFHTDLHAELPPGWPYATPVDVTPWVEHYRRIYGPPVYTDPRVIVFDVTRLDVPLRPASSSESATALMLPETQSAAAAESTR
jgi:hypothetical protein